MVINMPTRRNIIDLDHSCLSNATWEAAIKSIPMSRKSIHVLDMCVGLHDVCTYMRLQKKIYRKIVSTRWIFVEI